MRECTGCFGVTLPGPDEQFNSYIHEFPPNELEVFSTLIWEPTIGVVGEYPSRVALDGSVGVRERRTAPEVPLEACRSNQPINQLLWAAQRQR